MSPVATARVPRWLDAASLLALFAALLAATWRRWPDALVDVWRNLYIPWRLSEGALLYVDVTDWYGPLPSLINGAAFSRFGPGLDVLVAVNVAVALGCLFTLRDVLRRVGDAASAWVGSAVFVLVFCFGQYSQLGNYNFMTPYVVQATWGFLGVLLTLDGVLANATQDSARGWLLAGAGLAVAWLSKAETLLAAAVVVLAWCALRRRLPALRFGVGFAAVGAPVALLLMAEGGVGYGLRAFNQVIAFTLSPDVRATLATVPIFSTDLGTNAPLDNALSHLGAGGLLLTVVALLALAPRAWARSRPVTGLLGLALGLAVVGLTDWLRIGRALLLPTLGLAGLSTLLSLRGKEKWVPLSLFSLTAAAMLARMALNVRVFHYGFTMAVLATMVAVHLLVFEAPRWRLAAGALPSPGLVGAAAVLVLAGSARLTWHSLQVHATKTVAVGHGRDAITAFPPEQQRHPAQVNEMLAAVEKYAPDAKTLVAFPDSAAVSYLSRRPSPIPEFEFNPVSLGFSGVDGVLERLTAHPPDVVLVGSYDLRSHGAPFFGATDESGRALAVWVRANYVTVASGPPGPFSVSGHLWNLLARRPVKEPPP